MDRHTTTEKLGLGELGSPMEKPQYPEAHCVDYTQLNIAGLLHTGKQRGGVIYSLGCEPGLENS